MEDEEKLISKEEKENWSQSQLGLRQFSIATAVIIIRKFFKMSLTPGLSSGTRESHRLKIDFFGGRYFLISCFIFRY